MCRWMDAGVFEALVSDAQSIARAWAFRQITGVQNSNRVIQLGARPIF